MKKLLVFLILLSFIPQNAFLAATNMYVTVTGAGAKNGLTWATAFSITEFETDAEGAAEAGDAYYFEEGTYTLTSAIAVALDGTAVAPISIVGVVSGTTAEPPTSADFATGDNRPLIAAAAFSFIFDDYWILRNMRLATTTVNGLRIDTGGIMENCKSVNTSLTLNRPALRSGGLGSFVNNEGISTNGIALNIITPTFRGHGNYLHDSLVGISAAGRTVSTSTIISSCVTAYSGVSNDDLSLLNNTLYNGTAGITATDSARNLFLNNNISNFTTGASWTTEQKSNWFDYNNWFNNTADVSNVTKGDNATALDPEFADVAIITGTDGETTGGVLASTTAKDFSEVVANQDYCWIKSGTTVTADEHHLITAVDDGADTITLSPDPGDSGTDDITWSVTTGHDFSIGNNLRGQGFPGTFPGGLSIGHLDIGAVQVPSATTIYDATIYDATIF